MWRMFWSIFLEILRHNGHGCRISRRAPQSGGAPQRLGDSARRGGDACVPPVCHRGNHRPAPTAEPAWAACTACQQAARFGGVSPLRAVRGALGSTRCLACLSLAAPATRELSELHFSGEPPFSVWFMIPE
jgi:hypothetical protein